MGALIEAKMAHEINLTNARMTWLVVSESFIFSADAVILSASNQTPAGHALLWALPIVGILLVIFVWFSLMAAKKVMNALVYDRAKMDKIIEEVTSLGLTSLGPVRDTTVYNTHRAGNMAVELVPLLLVFAWIAVAILQFRT